MELLQERIRREGRVLPGNIVKVDGFLNHRVDTRRLLAVEAVGRLLGAQLQAGERHRRAGGRDDLDLRLLLLADDG